MSFNKIWATLLLATALSSCSLMHDDLPECVTGVDVSIKFDYNIERENRFDLDINGVTVYVFDAEGRYVTKKRESGEALHHNDYTMHLELVPGNYKLLAMGSEDNYDIILSQPGAHVHRTPLNVGDHIDDFIVYIEREGGVVDQQGNPVYPHYQSMELVDITAYDPVDEDPQPTHVTIPMMRLTNNLNLHVWRTDFPTYIDPEDLDISITSRNGRYSYTNELVDDEEFRYLPYASGAVERDGKAMANAQLSFLRLFPNSATPTTLHVHDRLTGRDNNIPLARVLEAFKDADEYAKWNYSSQEFLDRQYDYDVELEMTGGIVKYAVIRIPVLNWSKRIQLVNLM